MARAKKEEVKEEVKKVDLSSIKEELKDYVDLEIKKNFKGEIDRANRKLINEKNKKIYSRDIVIVLLLLVIVFLIYRLNSLGYFNKFFVDGQTINNNTNIVDNNSSNNNNNKSNENVVVEPTLDELKNKYAQLLDNIVINEESSYKTDFYNGNLNDEIKRYISLNNVDFDKILYEDYSIIDEELLKSEYDKLFDDYSSGSFNYNVSKIRYIEKLKSYITNSILLKEESNIKREITNIKVDSNKVYITTIEGVVKDNKLFNVITLDEVKTYENDSLTNYKDSLNKITYVFLNNKLIDIEQRDL